MKIARVLFVAAFFLAMPTITSAHTTLISSNPANGSTIQIWPTSLELTFAEPLQKFSAKKVNFVSVNNARSEPLNFGEILVKNNVITIPVKENLTPGLVLVNYRVAAEDGHVLNGEFAFNFRSTTPGGGLVSSTAITSTHGSSGSTAIYGASTVLIVLTLLFGIWAYRKRA